MNFNPLDNNGLVEGFCIIKSIDVKTSSRGDSYLDMMLSDADGEINAKLWRYSKEIHGEYTPNALVKVRGNIAPYNGVDQLKIDKIRPAVQSDGVDPADFVKTALYSGEEMFSELYGLADSFEDEDLRKIVCAILEDNRLKLLYWPAAFKLHHAVRSGLMLHTLSIVRLAQNVCKVYPFVDEELLIAGAILHDIAKLSEFEVADTGIASDVPVLLKHMCLSHHGEPEFGAAVRPMFIEAELLSELDLMDSRVYEMKEAVEAAESGDFTGRIWAMENRKLYNHARKDITKETKLF